MSADDDPAFERIQRPGMRALVARERVSALRAAGLLDPTGIEAALAHAAGAHGRAPTAIVALAQDFRLVVRPLRRGGLLGPLLGSTLFGPRRPLREFEVCAALRHAGAPVPETVLAVAWRRGLRWRGAVTTRMEEGVRDGLAFLEATPTQSGLASALRAAGHAVRRFHDAGGSHADLHVKNLLVRELPTSCEVLVVDLDRARRMPSVSGRRRAVELMRLYRSLHKRRVIEVVGERGCVTFWRAYWYGDRSLRASVAEHLPQQRRRSARHIRAYPRP